jgi:hypothetical protein
MGYFSSSQYGTKVLERESNVTKASSIKKSIDATPTGAKRF